MASRLFLGLLVSLGLLFSTMLRVAAQEDAGAETVKVCRGVEIPPGYVVVGEAVSPECSSGAYLIKREGERDVASGARVAAGGAPGGDFRPRRVVPVLRSSDGGEGGAGLESSVASDRRNREGGGGGVRRQPLPAAEEVGAGDVVRVETNLVTVPVSVLDRQGRFVGGLRRGDFRLYEDGVEQAVSFFEPVERPFTVALVLDMSESTRFRLEEIREAAVGFLDQLHQGDRVLVVTFDEDVLLLAEATSERLELTRAINYYTRMGSTTRLYDAVQFVISQRLSRIEGRKAIVLFTDGVDTASEMATYEETVRAAEELDAMIYPVRYDTFDDVRRMYASDSFDARRRQPASPDDVYDPVVVRQGYERAAQYLETLAASTGGRLFRADNPKELARAFTAIAEELRCQYSLGYYPRAIDSGGSGDVRRRVRVKIPSRADVVVRSRESYLVREASQTRW